jgi:uncharacterized repeat protein (TIGR04076 family)
MMIILALLPGIIVEATSIRWVDFQVPYESLQYAMNTDISTSEKENHLSWIQILALSGSKTGGKCPIDSVRQAVEKLEKGWTPADLSHEQRKQYDHYYQIFNAILGGMLGHYAIDGKAAHCRLGIEKGDTFIFSYECPAGICPRVMTELFTWCEVIRCGGDFTYRGMKGKYEMDLPCPCRSIKFHLKATPINRDENGNPLPNGPRPVD